jgi:hypothetical protein
MIKNADLGGLRTCRTEVDVPVAGLSCFSADEVEYRPPPDFENRGGYLVSFDIPGIVLGISGSDRDSARSEWVPLIATR